MTRLTLAIPSVGEKNTVAEPKVDVALGKVEEWANGKVGTENIEAGTVTEAMLATAVVEKLTTKLGLSLVAQAASVTGVSEKLYEMTTNATTVTLPTPTTNRLIGVYCGGGIAGCKVTASSGKIFGDFLTAGATTVELTTCQHVLVQADGSNWLIIAGEPKRETEYAEKTYSKAEAEAGFELSATRPGFLLASPQAGGTFGGASVTVNGHIVTVSGTAQLSCPVNAGQKVKCTVALNTAFLLQ
jgi:hypothetical protein